jgi:hypothetical protein
MTPTTEEARRIVAELQTKLADATSRAADLQTERRRLAFDANTGDPKARKALDAANAESATASLEIENVKSAIDEAKRRLQAAEHAEKDAENAENAKGALVLSASIAARGRKLDEALLTLAMEAEGLEEDLGELNYRLGIAYPSLANFRAIIERPFYAGLMFQPSGKTKPNGQPADGTLKLRHLPPGERMTFAEICEGYAKTIRRTSSMVLGESEAA